MIGDVYWYSQNGTPPTVVYSLDGEWANAAWWTKSFGLAGSSNKRRRAEKIYERLHPLFEVVHHQIIVIGDAPEGGAVAVALPDGSVVLNLATVDLCLNGLDEELGDACLAFVIGHELAHLLLLEQDPFCAASFFSGIRISSAPQEEVLRTSQIQREDCRREHELRADQLATLAMMLAGYDPTAIVDSRVNLFYRWRMATSNNATPTHNELLSPLQREIHVRSALVGVVPKDAAFFQFVQRSLREGAPGVGRLYAKLAQGSRDPEVLGALFTSHVELPADGRTVCRGSNEPS